MSGLVSLKRFSWFFSGVVAVVITVAGLGVSDFAWLPVQYQKYVVMIIGVSGVLAKVFVENARVVRAEELVHEEYRVEALSNDDINDCISHDEQVLNDEYAVSGDGDG